MIKIIIADDHSVVRRGIKEILSASNNFNIVGEATSGEELLELLSKQVCEVVIMDISMPGRSGLDVLNDIKKFYPSVRCLVLSVHPEEKYGLRVIKSGADGYLTKESAPEELIKALDKINEGGKYLSPGLTDKIVDEITRDQTTAPLHSKLSDREYEIFLLLAEGKPVSEIASKFFLSVHTVSTYRGRILEKMNMKTNADLTYYAVKNKLIE
jgi:DNA-binding NarL/FixJ family response regulator